MTVTAIVEKIENRLGHRPIVHLKIQPITQSIYDPYPTWGSIILHPTKNDDIFTGIPLSGQEFTVEITPKTD